MKWRHLQERDLTGQITVFAKGDKTRSVLFPKSVWDTLLALRGDASPDTPVFRSRKKGHLCESAVWRVVKKATKRTKIPKEVSCHWFRHVHASHALDRGAGIHLVQATLGHSSVATTGRYLHARPSDSSGNYLPLGYKVLVFPKKVVHEVKTTKRTFIGMLHVLDPTSLAK